MKKTLGERLRDLFLGTTRNGLLLEELEDILVEADIGASLAAELVEALRGESAGIGSKEALGAALKALLKKYLKVEPLTVDPGRLNLFLVLGVNGVGKTTTIAKLASFFGRTEGIAGITLAAGDTFRAGAIEQLKVHGDRLGARVVSQQQGSDPGAVIYDAIDSARARGGRLVLADTAGRMHTKANLVKELEKIDKVIRSRIGDGQYRKVLVIDATTGQNGLRQAEIFNEAVGVSSAILAKYDSAAKGGIAVSISKTLGIPFSFLGRGEKVDDLEVFDPDRYLDTLFEA